MINLNSLSKKLLLLQRNELLSRRQKFLRKRFGRFIFTNFLINFFQKENIEYVSSKLFQDEIDTIKNFLPKKAYNIMDIGCGLGIINIFLNEIYQNEACFYLLDKNHIDTKIKYGFSLIFPFILLELFGFLFIYKYMFFSVYIAAWVMRLSYLFGIIIGVPFSIKRIY